MEDSTEQVKVKAIYRMLFEIINGNLSYRLHFYSDDLKFNQLVKSLNDFASKLEFEGIYNPYLKTVAKEVPKDLSGIITQVQDYILNNLENNLPTSKELAHMFGTNEFTLKLNFRQFYKTSIYQFYNDERLKKAHVLIDQTAIPLANVATLCGFNNYSNFLKAFKKKYSYTPSDVPRKNNSENEKYH